MTNDLDQTKSTFAVQSKDETESIKLEEKAVDKNPA
jgi:hypothetical protein